MTDYELHCLAELFILHKVLDRHGYTFTQFLNAYKKDEHKKLLMTDIG